jgi:hypothetical protein
MDKINARLASLNIATLQDMARKLFADQRDGSEIVFSAVLSAIDARMTESDFVAFCEGIE